jgi:hypothetical protein
MRWWTLLGLTVVVAVLAATALGGDVAELVAGLTYLANGSSIRPREALAISLAIAIIALTLQVLAWRHSRFTVRQAAAVAGAVFLSMFASIVTGSGIAALTWAIFHPDSSVIAFVIILTYLVGFTGAVSVIFRIARHRWAAANATLPPADTLNDRIAQAQAALGQALASVSGTLNTLEYELEARRTALNELAAQAKEAQAKADMARELARIDGSAAGAVDALLTKRYRELFHEQERENRRWDIAVTVFSLFAGAAITEVINTELWRHLVKF